MRRRVEMRGHGESEAYQRHERRDGVYDENGRQRMSRAGGQREVGIGGVSEEAFCANCQFEALICLSARGNVPVSYPIMGPLHAPFSQ